MTTKESLDFLPDADNHMIVATNGSEVFASIDSNLDRMASIVADLMERDSGFRNVVLDATITFLKSHKEILKNAILAN